MNAKKYSKIIMDSNNDAKSLELTGTPAFFVINSNGEVSKLFGAQPFEVFQKIFDAELEK
jgi:protein-disulfide isomerase